MRGTKNDSKDLFEDNIDTYEDIMNSSLDGWSSSSDLGDWGSGSDNFNDIDDFFSEPKNEKVELDKPSTGRIVGSVFMGLFISSIISLVIFVLYMNWIKYPPEESISRESTGMYCLENWVDSLVSMESLGEESYIAQEVVYANGNENRVNFYTKMLGTISYSPDEVEVNNIYGNTMIDRKTKKVVVRESTIKENEEVTFSYIDYDSIEFDKTAEAEIKKLMKESKVKYGCADYNNKMVDIFCKYMLSLDLDELPIKSIKRVPNMKLVKQENEDGTVLESYYMTDDEDVYIDQLLFSSKEFYDLLDRFSVTAANASGKELKPTEKWSKWNTLNEENKSKTDEPTKYNVKKIVNRQWCGVYYLKNDAVVYDENGNIISKGIIADLGDGSLENPAAIGTSILTSVIKKNSKGKYTKYPIRVRMVEYGVSEDAISWFESINEKNRGIDISSEVQFCYYKFEVTNLSNKTLTIKDNSALCDSSAMLSARTGTIFGVKDKIKLKPDETGIIESWNKSTELNKKYVVWGADFERQESLVWFRVLAGDLEDTSENKGVTLNETRNGTSDETETENTETIENMQDMYSEDVEDEEDFNDAEE